MPLSFNKRTTSFVVLPWFVTTNLCDAIVETILEPIKSSLDDRQSINYVHSVLTLNIQLDE